MNGEWWGPWAGSRVSVLLSPTPIQFDCTNTLNDRTLENVTVYLEPTEAYEVLCYVPARSLPYNQPGTCYTLVALPKEDPTAGEPLRCHLAYWEPWKEVGTERLLSWVASILRANSLVPVPREEAEAPAKCLA